MVSMAGGIAEWSVRHRFNRWGQSRDARSIIDLAQRQFGEMNM
jgi:hypothetical protein